MTRAGAIAITALLWSAVPAAAQKVELSALGGYTPGVAFDEHAPEIDDAGIGGGVTFSFQGAWFFTPRWGVEAAWSQQFSAYQIEAGGDTVDVHDMSIYKIYGHVVYRFGAADARLQPYAFGGVGSTGLTARDLDTESKLSFALGAGLQYFRWPGIGLVGRFRFTPIMMNDSGSADFCDPFGYCQSTLRQVDLMGGVVFRF